MILSSFMYATTIFVLKQPGNMFEIKFGADHIFGVF